MSHEQQYSPKPGTPEYLAKYLKTHRAIYTADNSPFQMAAKLGMNPTEYYGFEKGQSGLPDQEILARWAKVLNREKLYQAIGQVPHDTDRSILQRLKSRYQGWRKQTAYR